jgi:hypothetical protein
MVLTTRLELSGRWEPAGVHAHARSRAVEVCGWVTGRRWLARTLAAAAVMAGDVSGR